jgi:hypothetical protein
MTGNQKNSFRDCSRLTGRISLFVLCTLFLASCALPPGKNKQTAWDLGKWSQTEIDRLLNNMHRIRDPGQKVTVLSAAFRDTPYRANTLIGDNKTAEVFVLRLDSVDCFTFLDNVEALRRSSNFSEFVESLHHVRYRNGRVDFQTRNHFFSQWGNSPLAPLRDITAQIGGSKTCWAVKYLNQKKGGHVFLPGYPIRRQTVAFIPAEAIDEAMLARLQSGDYIGIYSPHPGLDVSHTGIVIKKEGTLFLRHASSKRWYQKVRDEELLPYLAGKKGLIIYRPVAVKPFQF